MISSGNGEIKEIYDSDNIFTPVLPVSGIELVVSISGFTVTTCPFKSFNNKLFSGDSLIYFEFGSGSRVQSDKNITEAYASDNYANAFFISNSNLYRKAVGSSDEPELLNGSCSSFALSANGRIIWYTDLSNALHFLSGSTDRVISGDVDGFAIIPSGRSAVFISGGLLYYNRNGKPRQTYLIEQIQPSSVASDASGMYYRTDPGGWSKLPSGGKRVDLSN